MKDIKASGYLPTSECRGGTAVGGYSRSWWLLHFPLLPGAPQSCALIYRKSRE